MAHALQTLSLELGFADEALAWQQQAAVQRYASDRLPALLAGVLDEFDEAGQVWQLERLQLQLGELPADPADPLWDQRLQQALRDALSAARQDASRPGARLSQAERQLQQLQRWLLQGDLAALADAERRAELPAALLQALLREPGRGALLRLLREAPATAWRRLAAVASPALQAALVRAWPTEAVAPRDDREPAAQTRPPAQADEGSGVLLAPGWAPVLSRLFGGRAAGLMRRLPAALAALPPAQREAAVLPWLAQALGLQPLQLAQRLADQGLAPDWSSALESGGEPSAFVVDRRRRRPGPGDAVNERIAATARQPVPAQASPLAGVQPASALTSIDDPGSTTAEPSLTDTQAVARGETQTLSLGNAQRGALLGPHREAPLDARGETPLETRSAAPLGAGRDTPRGVHGAGSLASGDEAPRDARDEAARGSRNDASLGAGGETSAGVHGARSLGAPSEAPLRSLGETSLGSHGETSLGSHGETSLGSHGETSGGSHGETPHEARRETSREERGESALSRRGETRHATHRDMQQQAAPGLQRRPSRALQRGAREQRQAESLPEARRRPPAGSPWQAAAEWSAAAARASADGAAPPPIGSADWLQRAREQPAALAAAHRRSGAGEPAGSLLAASEQAQLLALLLAAGGASSLTPSWRAVDVSEPLRREAPSGFDAWWQRLRPWVWERPRALTDALEQLSRPFAARPRQARAASSPLALHRGRSARAALGALARALPATRASIPPMRAARRHAAPRGARPGSEGSVRRRRQAPLATRSLPVRGATAIRAAGRRRSLQQGSATPPTALRGRPHTGAARTHGQASARNARGAMRTTNALRTSGHRPALRLAILQLLRRLEPGLVLWRRLLTPAGRGVPASTSPGRRAPAVPQRVELAWRHCLQQRLRRRWAPPEVAAGVDPSALALLDQGLALLLPAAWHPQREAARRWTAAALGAGLPLPAPRLQALPLLLLLRALPQGRTARDAALSMTSLPEAAWAALAPQLPAARRAACRDALLGALAGAPPTVETPADTRTDPDDAPLMIGNAGLVLCAFFLPRLWRRLGLLSADGKAFVAPAAACRAAQWLQRLASGVDEAPEHWLMLNKLLCGLPLATPLPPPQPVPPAEADALDGLLRALIAHWQALGKTSVPGLRASFLMRQGALRRRSDEGWQLRVQARAYDLLLDRLPWTYKTIKLPWMAEALHVDWR